MNLSVGKNTKLTMIYAALAVAVLLSTYAITGLGSEKGLMVGAFIIAIGAGLFTLIDFKFGFYAAILLAHTPALLHRMIGDVIPTAFLVDLQINATFAGLLLHKVIKRETFFKSSDHVITYTYLLYTFYLVMQAFNPEMQSFEGWFFVMRKFVQFLMIYIIAVNLFRNLREIRFFLVFWGFCAFGTGLYGCYQQWFGLFQFEIDYIWAVPGRAALYALDNGDFRKFSICSGPAAFGILMGASSLLFIVLAVGERRFNKRLPWIIAAVVCMLGMAYAGTRTAYFVFSAGAVLYILTTITHRSSLILASLFFMAFAVIMWGPIYGNVTVNRIRSTFDTDDASLNVREINLQNIRPYIHSHPMGGGLASSGVQGLEYSPAHYLAGFPPDSGYVKTALETGWIGFFLQCLLYCIILLSGVRAYYRSKNREAKAYTLAALVTIFGFVISQYGQVSIGQIPDCFLFYSLLAIIVRLTRDPEPKITD